MTNPGSPDDTPPPAASSPPTANYRSVDELAAAFTGHLVLPQGWPKDAVSFTYHLDDFPGSPTYRVEATRADGTRVMIVGRGQSPSQRDGVDGWFSVPELAGAGGLARHAVDEQLHVVIADPAHVHLIGFRSLDEVLDVVASLQQVDAA